MQLTVVARFFSVLSFLAYSSVSPWLCDFHERQASDHQSVVHGDFEAARPYRRQQLT